jgi:serine/threonine protein kinase
MAAITSTLSVTSAPSARPFAHETIDIREPKWGSPPKFAIRVLASRPTASPFFSELPGMSKVIHFTQTAFRKITPQFAVASAVSAPNPARKLIRQATASLGDNCLNIFQEHVRHRFSPGRKPIGRGKFANVYITKDATNNKSYAGKFLKDSEPEDANALQKEAEFLRSLPLCPYVPKVILFCSGGLTEDQNAFLIQTLLPKDLHSQCKKGRAFALDEIRNYLGHDLMCAANWIHRKGILHRDIKPDNIAYDKQAFLFDFNCAAKISEVDYTKRVQAVAYRCPQASLRAPYSYEIDMWSIGVTLFEIFTQTSLFQFSQAGMQDLDGCHEFFQQAVPLIGPPPIELLESADPKFVKRCFKRVDGTLQLRGPATSNPISSIHDQILAQAQLKKEAPTLACQFSELVQELISYNPPTARKAMEHPFFEGIDFTQKDLLDEMDEKQFA